MTPPMSRGHKLVDLVMPYVRESPASPPEEIVTTLQRELNEEFLEVPPETSLPSITISEQDLQYSKLCSNNVPENLTPGTSTVIEFIVNTETITEPNDIALEVSNHFNRAIFPKCFGNFKYFKYCAHEKLCKLS